MLRVTEDKELGLTLEAGKAALIGGEVLGHFFSFVVRSWPATSASRR